MKKFLCEKYNVNDDEYLIVDVFKKSGEKISEDDVLFELETSKADIDINAEDSGFVYHNLKENDSVKVGEILYCISKSEIKNFDYSIFNNKEKNNLSDELNLEDVTFSKGAKDLIKKENLDINEIISNNSEVDFFSKEFIESILKTNNEDYKSDLFKLKKIAFIGGGKGFTQCLDLLSNLKNFIPAIIYDDTISKNTKIHGVSVKGKINEQLILKDYESGLFDFFVVSISTNLIFRAKIFDSLKSLKIPSVNLIHPNVYVGSNFKIGEGNIIFGSVNIGPEVKIGDNNFISSFSNIEHHCNINSNCTFGPGVIFSGSVTVNNNVKFGTGIFCEPNTIIGEKSIISSGSIITRNVKAGSILITKIEQYYKK